eukprot:30025_2
MKQSQQLPAGSGSSCSSVSKPVAQPTNRRNKNSDAQRCEEQEPKRHFFLPETSPEIASNTIQTQIQMLSLCGTSRRNSKAPIPLMPVRAVRGRIPQSLRSAGPARTLSRRSPRVPAACSPCARACLMYFGTSLRSLSKEEDSLE